MLKTIYMIKVKRTVHIHCEVVLFNVISDFLLGNNYSNKLDFLP